MRTQRAANIDIDRQVWDRVGDTVDGLRGHVVEVVWLHLVEHLAHAWTIGDVAIEQVDVLEYASQRREVGSRADDAVNFRAWPQFHQRAGDVRANHTADTCDQSSLVPGRC